MKGTAADYQAKSVYYIAHYLTQYIFLKSLLNIEIINKLINLKIAIRI